MRSVGVQRDFRTRRTQKRAARLFLYGAFALALAGGAGFFVFGSGFFEIRRVSVNGTEVVGQADVERVLAEYLAGPALFSLTQKRNELFFREAEAQAALEKAFPRIARAQVVLRLVDRDVVVNIRERVQAGIACVRGTETCYFFDTQGDLFAMAPLITGASLLAIQEDAIDVAPLPRRQYKESDIAYLAATKKEVSRRAGIDIASFSFMNSYGDVQADTIQGFKLLLTMNQDPAKLAQVLHNILTVEVKNQVGNLDYIDLRVENRAYYKLRDALNGPAQSSL